MSLISPNAGLYNSTLDSPPINLTGYALGDKATLIDGDKSTPCGSNNGWNVTWESYGLDLGSVQTVASFKLYDDNAQGVGPLTSGQIIVLYGSDNNNWTQLEQVETPTLSRTNNITTCPLTTPTSARYWRLYISGVVGVGGNAIEFSELEAYESPIVSASGSITSDAYVLAYSTADPQSFTVNQDSPQITIQECREPKLKHTCDHVLASGRYTLTTCSRCLGRGYYYDLKFNELGLVDQITNEDKLVQELEKITLTPVGDNIFHDQYGTLVARSHLTAATRELQEVTLKRSIIEAVLHLKQTQELEIFDGSPFSTRELIASIKKVEILSYSTNPTSVQYVVHISTLSGIIATLKGTIIL